MTMPEDHRGSGDGRRCPDDATLRAFAVGDVAEDAFERLAAHVKDCERCESALRGFEGDGDDLVARLRTLPDHADDPIEPLSAELIDTARAAYHQRASASGADVVIDPGQHIAMALAVDSYRLGRFELVEKLGVGSFGYVFKARDTELDRDVAIKVSRTGRSVSDTLYVMVRTGPSSLSPPSQRANFISCVAPEASRTP